MPKDIYDVSRGREGGGQELEELIGLCMEISPMTGEVIIRDQEEPGKGRRVRVARGRIGHRSRGFSTT